MNHVYLIGIHLGMSNLSAVLIDAKDGREISNGSVSSDIIGNGENPISIRIQLISSLFKNSSILPSDVIGIGIATAKSLEPTIISNGKLIPEIADAIGFNRDIIVTANHIDMQVSLLAVGIVESAKMLMIMGETTYNVILDNNNNPTQKLLGAVRTDVAPGYTCYEIEQSSVGDHFDWFVKNCVPESYYREASALEMTIHQLLRSKAELQKVGESGLLALDWWNGNKGILKNENLSGMLLGMCLDTRPEEVYRALIEATAYGTRNIIEELRENNVLVNELYATGSISRKDPFMLQTYADVTNMDIRVSLTKYAPAYGVAMQTAVDCGIYKNIQECKNVMGGVMTYVYKPIKENVEAYDKLFSEYKKLHNYFGCGGNNIMQILNGFKKKSDI
ncbi:MAG: FGGY-family carbohydrate kinase [Oscillospiraceae bacterium]